MRTAALIFALPLAAAAERFPPKACQHLADSATWEKVVGPRLPSVATDQLDPSCLPEVSGLRDHFVVEDEAQWERLANAWCSHRAGWVEKEAGSCQAGGPPPICTADHWKRDERALERWSKDAASVAAERAQKLSAAACACMSQVIGPKPVAFEPAPLTRALTACAADGDCPPGMACKRGGCVAPDTAGPSLVRSVRDAPADLAKDAVSEAAVKAVAARLGSLGAFITRAFALFGSKAMGALALLIDPSPLHTQRDAYVKAVERIGKAARQLDEQATQAHNDVAAAARGQKPQHGSAYHQAQLDAAKRDLTAQLGNLELAWQGMKRERELAVDECPQVFEAANAQLRASVTSLNATSVRTFDPTRVLPPRGLWDAPALP